MIQGKHRFMIVIWNDPSAQFPNGFWSGVASSDDQSAININRRNWELLYPKHVGTIDTHITFTKR